MRFTPIILVGLVFIIVFGISRWLSRVSNKTMRVQEGLSFEESLSGIDKEDGAPFDAAYQSRSSQPVGKEWPSSNGHWPPVHDIMLNQTSVIESFTSVPETHTRLRSIEQLTSVSEDEIVVLKVYAKWCGYCNKMASEWRTFTSEFNEKQHGDYTVRVVDVGCENPELRKRVMSKYGLTGFPSILGFVRKGDHVENVVFKGPRTSSGLKAFVSQLSQIANRA